MWTAGSGESENRPTFMTTPSKAGRTKRLEIATHQLHEKLRKTHFAIRLDDTTTASGESALIIYVQYIDLKQDILTSTNPETTTTGQDIFLAVDYDFSSSNLS